MLYYIHEITIRVSSSLTKLYNITTATALMIKGYRVDTTYDTVTLSWDMPKYLPQLYKWDVSCTLLCGNTAYNTKSVTVGSLETKDYITNLLPGSRCAINFRAVYNPASLDEGLANIVYTEEKGEQHTHVHL